MGNLNVLKFFTLTRTCMHLKVGLNKNSLGKTENLIFTTGLLFLLYGIYPPPPPPPQTHTPVPSLSLNAISLQSPAGVLLHFFTFKEDHVSLFLVKIFFKPVHTRLNKRPSVFCFFFLSFFNCMWPYTYKRPSQEFWEAGKKSHLFSDSYYI